MSLVRAQVDGYRKHPRSPEDPKGGPPVFCCSHLHSAPPLKELYAPPLSPSSTEPPNSFCLCLRLVALVAASRHLRAGQNADYLPGVPSAAGTQAVLHPYTQDRSTQWTIQQWVHTLTGSSHPVCHCSLSTSPEKPSQLPIQTQR